MVIFVIVEFAILIGSYYTWVLDQGFMDIGYYIYHIYPVFLFLFAFMFKRKIDKYSTPAKLFAILIPFIIWFLGVWYINNHIVMY